MFCAYCLRDCGTIEEGHRHASHCPLDTNKIGLFATVQEFHRVQYLRQSKEITELFTSLLNTGGGKGKEHLRAVLTAGARYLGDYPQILRQFHRRLEHN